MEGCQNLIDFALFFGTMDSEIFTSESMLVFDFLLSSVTELACSCFSTDDPYGASLLFD